MVTKQPRVPKHDHGVLGQIIAEQGNISAETITSGTLDGDRLPAISTTKKGGVPAVTPGTPSEYLRDTGDFEVIQQNEVQSLHDTDIVVFDTVNLTELTDTYVPYQDDIKPGLVDSNITIDKPNGRVGINVVVPQATEDVKGLATDDLKKIVDASDNLRHKRDYLGVSQDYVADGTGEKGLIEHTVFEGCPCISMWTYFGGT